MSDLKRLVAALCILAGIWLIYDSVVGGKSVEFSAIQADAATLPKPSNQERASVPLVDLEALKAPVQKSFSAKRLKDLNLKIETPLDLRFAPHSGNQLTVAITNLPKGTEKLKMSDWLIAHRKNSSLILRALESGKESSEALSLMDLARRMESDQSARGPLVHILFPEDHHFRNINIEMVHSDLNIVGAKFDRLNSAGVTSQHDIKSSSVQHLRVATVSGNSDVEVAGLKTANFESVSGSTMLISLNSQPKVAFESVSGSLVLSVPRERGIDVRFESLSGDLSNEFGLSQTGASQLEFSSLSGSAKIKKL